MEPTTVRIKRFNQIEALANFSDYSVDVDGNVWSHKYNRIKKLKPRWAKRRGSYLSVSLRSRNGMIKTFYIHRLVAMAFIPNPHNKREVKHLNGNLSDNRVENLEWSTKSESRTVKVSTAGYELDITITKRIKDIHTASVRKGLTIPSSYDFMKEIIEKGIQEHVRQYGLQKILHQMNQ